MLKRIMVLAGLIGTVGLLMAAGRPGVVRTKDGGIYDGQVEEQQETVKITVRGIQTTIPRENIASIVYGDFETRWNTDYEKLAEKDTKGRMDLAKRAFEERRYDLAEKALNDTLAIDPNNADAAELLRLTLIQRRLEKSTAPASDSKSTPPGSTSPQTATPSSYNTLSPEQIQIIKQGELSETDTRVNISFKNNVQKKYHDTDPNTGMNYTQFLRQPAVVRALMIIRNGGDELAKDVEVINDPATMLAFRRDVLPIVLNGCATSSCHGGNNESTREFALITPAAGTPEVYTNYYLLHSYKKNISSGSLEGFFNPEQAMMIDRLNPAKSLLLQYGLPSQLVDYKHPNVRGYNGIFPRGREDPKYRTIENWINSLGKIDRKYDIDFKLQRRSATGAPPFLPTTPSTAPAAQSR